MCPIPIPITIFCPTPNITELRTAYFNYQERCEACAFSASCQLRYEYDAFVQRHASDEKLQNYRSYGMLRTDPCVLFAEYDNSNIPGNPGRERGALRVSDGIGNDYKIILQNGLPDNTVNVWKTYQPILIWAPTSSGKNFFVNKQLVPYVKDLSFRTSKKYRVLILSNRLALKNQIKSILRDQSKLENDDQQIFQDENGFVTVMTYQSLLDNKNFQNWVQNNPLLFPFVVCDEAHFFTSDAAFNPDTKRILSCLTSLFNQSIRIYMTATPYECINPIKMEERKNFGSQPVRTLVQPYPIRRGPFVSLDHYRTDYMDVPPVCYHFSGNYDHLDIRSFTNFTKELLEEICNNITNSRENWIVFNDNKRWLDQIERELKHRLPGHSNAVLNVSSESKRSPLFQEMVMDERLPKGIRILLSTSVLDNGINLRNVDNIVVMEMDKIKCLQMAGRARVSDERHKTLFLKQFQISDVEKKLKRIEEIRRAFLDYDLLQNNNYPGGVPAFLNKYYLSSADGWTLSSHLFRLSFSDDPNSKSWRDYISSNVEANMSQSTNHVDDQVKPEWDQKIINFCAPATVLLHDNPIERAKAELDQQYYQQVYDEMLSESENQEDVGRQYLAYQFSWFGKTLAPNDDHKMISSSEAMKKLEEWLDSFVGREGCIVFLNDNEATLQEGEISSTEFYKNFLNLYQKAFGTFDPNAKKRTGFGKEKINNHLKEHEIPYRIEGSRKCTEGPWTVIKTELSSANSTTDE